MLMGGLIGGASLIGADLLNNKILVGKPLQPLQATLLLLDESYVIATNAADSSSNISDKFSKDERLDEATQVAEVLLTDAQRRVVRNRTFIWAAVIGLLLMVSLAGVGYYMVWVQQRINQHLRVSMLERAENLSLKFHDQARTGDAIYRVYQDSATITNVLIELITRPLRMVATLLFIVVLVTFFSPWLGLMCLVVAIPVGWLFVRFTPRIQLRSRQAREANSNLTSRIQEVFSAIKVVKANRAESMVINRFNAESKLALDAAFLLRMETILLSLAVAILLAGMLLVAEYLMAGWSISEEATYLGGIVTLVGFATWNLGAYQSASASISESARHSRDLANTWAAAQDLAVGLDRAFYLLDLEPEVLEAEHTVDFPSPIQQVTWQDTVFSYKPEYPVLNGINLTAKTGTITAIVGSTGAGKSTLMSLLLRLYDPDSGNILVNNTNIRDLSLAELRSNVAIALQQNVLFATTVAENIGYASRDASRADIEAAAKVACANTFVEEMPLGYDTELGERGGKLSAGQRQRLSIARAILRDTPILILDEPTASLDAQTEHQVLKNLSEWGQNRVVFLITHRLSTIRYSNQIAFLEDGKIVELGSHADLMALTDGHYRGFVQAELSGAHSGTVDGV